MSSISYKIKKLKAEMKKQQEKLMEPPSDSPIHVNLWAGHRFEMETQRNILLNFIESKKLSKEADKYLDKYFPRDED